MMTPTFTDETVAAAQAGDSDAMWEIVSAHEALFSALVHQIAPKPTREQREDLLQEARAVLVERIRDYTAESSTASLTTYLYRTLRGAVTEAWIRMSTGLTVETSTIVRVRRALAEAGGNTELACLTLNARHRLDRATFLAAIDAMGTIDSLDTPVSSKHGSGDGNNELTLADVIADPTTDVTDPTERRELAAWLLSQIESRQSYALRSYHGVGMEQAEDTVVAFHLRVEPANVRKLRSRGIDAARVVAARHDLAA